MGFPFKKIFTFPAKVVTAPVKLVKKGVEKTMFSMVMGIIRHALTAGGGALVSHGLLTGDQASDAVGALITLIGIVWSVLEKRKQA
jgi:hypothetical protein